MQMRIRESSQAGEARREDVVQAASIGFGEERAGRVALVVSELTSNLLKHAGRGGELFISPLEQDGASAVEIPPSIAVRGLPTRLPRFATATRPPEAPVPASVPCHACRTSSSSTRSPASAR